MLFIQAENDYDLTPSYTLASELEGAGRVAQVRIFPPFGQSAQNGHDFCVRGAEVWGPFVLSFLDETMR
jgi:hypothetical protein